jgi:hypothetical protein
LENSDSPFFVIGVRSRVKLRRGGDIGLSPDTPSYFNMVRGFGLWLTADLAIPKLDEMFLTVEYAF